MLTVRKSNERGHAQHGWLDSHHTFSFANYHDPEHMGYRSLRVINEDRVAEGRGFGAHAHRDMEILSYVLKGKLAHKDSMGHVEVLGPNEIQKMSAGSGVVHSEFNGSETEPVHFLQIWIIPEKQGIAPGYEQKRFGDAEKRGKLRLVGSRDGRDGSVTIHQDVDLYAAILGVDESVTFNLKPGRIGWVQVATGTVTINGEELRPGDGVAFEESGTIAITGTDDSEVLLFDMVP